MKYNLTKNERAAIQSHGVGYGGMPSRINNATGKRVSLHRPTNHNGLGRGGQKQSLMGILGV